ncbi:putative membrane protein YuzI [Trichinella pseudospiralis]
MNQSCGGAIDQNLASSAAVSLEIDDYPQQHYSGSFSWSATGDNRNRSAKLMSYTSYMFIRCRCPPNCDSVFPMKTSIRYTNNFVSSSPNSWFELLPWTFYPPDYALAAGPLG